jgi:hypothetical protein
VTDDDARRLATRIIDTWPTGAKAYVWRDLLTPLDLELAHETYRRLEREIDKGAPTPGQFHAIYRGIEKAHEPAVGSAHQDVEQRMAPSEYLARVHARAQHGDRQAADELVRWERFTSGEMFARLPADGLDTLWQ